MLLCFSFGGPLGILEVQVGVHKIFPLHMRFKYLELILDILVLPCEVVNMLFVALIIQN